MLKFFGAFSCAAGTLSAAVAIGGGATGASLTAPSASGRPCAHGGGAWGWLAGAGCTVVAGAGPAGACCAASDHGVARRPAATNNVRERDNTDVMVFLPTGAG